MYIFFLFLQLFWPLKAFYFVTPGNYYGRSAVYLHLANAEWEACTTPGASAICVDSTDGSKILPTLSLIFPVVSEDDTYWVDMLCIIGLGLGWFLIGTYVVLRKANQYTKLHPPTPDTKRISKARDMTIMEEEKVSEEDEEVDAETGRTN